jgi:hypothetical protein
MYRKRKREKRGTGVNAFGMKRKLHERLSVLESHRWREKRCCEEAGCD